jgi:hypothetical protein
MSERPIHTTLPLEGNRFARPARKSQGISRGRRVAILAAVIVVISAGLAVYAFHFHDLEQRDVRQVATLRSAIRQVTSKIDREETSLRHVEKISKETKHIVKKVEHELALVKEDLKVTDFGQYFDGVTISSLKYCLGGVQAGLNAEALGNKTFATQLLQSVANFCHTAKQNGAQ